MNQAMHATVQGRIVYWRHTHDESRPNVVFLPGLTLDHTLFKAQVDALKDQWNILVWDGPGHGLSRPFDLNLDLETIAGYLHDILIKEGFHDPILVGHSLGGYISQAYMALYPGQVRGFVALDTGPLQASAVRLSGRLILKNMRPFFQTYTWDGLKKAVCQTTAYSIQGQSHMRSMMDSYGRKAYIDLASEGFRWIANSIADYPKAPVDCPTILVVGREDKAGSVRTMSLMWSRQAMLPLIWIRGAGHNASVDQPQEVNRVLESFVESLEGKTKATWNPVTFLTHLRHHPVS